eukprot:scaffold434_cov358-Prasinococcus_capsulatus_cf.AAC.15
MADDERKGAQKESLFTVSRYVGIKHSWSGKRKRIFCVARNCVYTLDPSDLRVTNSYEFCVDLAGVSVKGKDYGPDDFAISVISKEGFSKGKAKPIKWTCKHRAALLTDIHRAAAAQERYNGLTIPGKHFNVSRLRRRRGDWVTAVRGGLPTGFQLMYGLGVVQGMLRLLTFVRGWDAAVLVRRRRGRHCNRHYLGEYELVGLKLTLSSPCMGPWLASSCH